MNPILAEYDFHNTANHKNYSDLTIKSDTKQN